MKQIKKILVPTDFSANAKFALTHAQEIATRFDARIDLVHVIPTLKYFTESFESLESPLDNADKELYPTVQNETRQKLMATMDEYFSDTSKGEAILRIERKASQAIVELAEQNNYDLIVMPSKGRHGSHLLRGSTTDKVIRHSKVPVFNVDERLSSEGLKQILIPTDGSSLSFSALPLALSLAYIYEATITLYHVRELYGSRLEYENRNPQKSEELNAYDELIDCLNSYLTEEGLDHITLNGGEGDFENQFVVTDGASSHRIDCKTVIDKGFAAHQGIQEYASEHADVVVMATHGHSGLAHLLLGSTTEKVAQSLDLPVVTVKPKSGNFHDSK